MNPSHLLEKEREREREREGERSSPFSHAKIHERRDRVEDKFSMPMAFSLGNSI